MKQMLSLAASTVIAVILTLPAQGNALSVASLSQAQGPTTGGNSVTVHGSGFIEDESDRILWVKAGLNQAFAKTQSGKLYAWGRNNYGQLSTGDTVERHMPVEITNHFNGEEVIDIGAGSLHTLVVTKSGSVYSFGYNHYGSLGTGDNLDYIVKQNITAQFGGEKINKVYAWSYQSFAISESGKVFAWGKNDAGQLGTGSMAHYNLPQNITSQFGMDRIISIGVGNSHSTALAESGEVYAWGWNNVGQLGLGDTVNRPNPTNITTQFGGEKIKQIITGSAFNVAQTETDKIYTWGSNDYGQLGVGDTMTRYTPQDITSSTSATGTVEQIVAGGHHAAVLTDSGALYVWGRGDFGQIGNGTNANSSIPINITTQLSSEIAKSIYAGDQMVIAITENNDIYSWGYNQNGELATNSTASYNTPQKVTVNFNLGIIPVVQVDSIYFGSSRVRQLQVIDANTISLIVPSHSPGFVDVTINDIHGRTTALANGYEYIAIGAPNTGA